MAFLAHKNQYFLSHKTLRDLGRDTLSQIFKNIGNFCVDFLSSSG